MGALKRATNFGIGGVIGAAVGAVTGLLTSPGSGEDVRDNLRAKIDNVKAAGDAAQAAKEQELADKFRLTVGDPKSLPEYPSAY